MINVINEILRQQLKKLVENQKIQTYRERERGKKPIKWQFFNYISTLNIIWSAGVHVTTYFS